MKPSKDWPYRFNNVLLSILLCVTLFSCSSLPSQLRIEQPTWTIKGKIGYKKTGQKSGSASFTWQSDSENSLIHTFNPLGQHLFTLYQNKDIAIYQQADGKKETASNGEALLKKMSTFTFPVQNVGFWIQGKLAGDEQKITHDESQRIQDFSSQDWQVNWQYKSKQSTPFKIKLRQNNTSINIIIKSHEQFKKL